MYPHSIPHSWSGMNASGNSQVHNGNNTQNRSEFFSGSRYNSSYRVDGNHSITYNITNIIGCGLLPGAPGQPSQRHQGPIPQGQQFRPQGNQYPPATHVEPHPRHPIPPGLSDRQPPQQPPPLRIPVPQTQPSQVWPGRHAQAPVERSRPCHDDDGSERDDDHCKWLCGSWLYFLLLRL